MSAHQKNRRVGSIQQQLYRLRIGIIKFKMFAPIVFGDYRRNAQRLANMTGKMAPAFFCNSFRLLFIDGYSAFDDVGKRNSAAFRKERPQERSKSRPCIISMFLNKIHWQIIISNLAITLPDFADKSAAPHGTALFVLQKTCDYSAAASSSRMTILNLTVTPCPRSMTGSYSPTSLRLSASSS